MGVTETETKDVASTVCAELEKRFNRLVGASSYSLCTHCGWCVDACHVYRGLLDPKVSPVAKAEKVRRFYKSNHDWLSRILPSWTGAKPISEQDIDDLVDTAWQFCTLCERCVVNCPMGVETPQLLSAARGALTAAGKAPDILVQLADAAISREEHLDEMRGVYLDQIKSLETQVQDFLHDPLARIPVEEQADMLYVPLSGAHTVVPAAIVFNLVGASWSLSMFEAANYGLFIGDVPKAKRIAKRILDEAERTGAKEIVVTECGHAYGVLRWEAPKWFGGALPFRVRSIVELLDEYIGANLLPLDPSRNPEPVTYHDSCNLGRKGGIIEEPRRIIRAAAQNFVEMTPNRKQALCCGGGGGLVAISDWTQTRLTVGKPKADQIRKTGAEHILTSCDNCRVQLADLSSHYSLGADVFSLTELVVKALDPARLPSPDGKREEAQRSYSPSSVPGSG